MLKKIKKEITALCASHQVLCESSCLETEFDMGTLALGVSLCMGTGVGQRGWRTLGYSTALPNMQAAQMPSTIWSCPPQGKKFVYQWS